MPQPGLLAPDAGLWLVVVLSWFLVPVLVVVLIRIAMRPTIERLDRLARLLEPRNDQGRRESR